MGTVALIQNQIEAAHYGFTDARPLLRELGYRPLLHTAGTIAELPGVLAAGAVDAVILASNSLSDRTIRTVLTGERSTAALAEFLAGGGGLLCFHQLGLAGLSEATVSFLPGPLGRVRAIRRPADERAMQGTLAVAPSAGRHITLLYPTQIDPKAIQAQALGFRSHPGLYRHTWTDVDLADWDVLLVDPSSPPPPRFLLLASKQQQAGRVVLCALAADWQRQRELLRNLLVYVVEGRHNTAVLHDPAADSIAFDYLLATLDARRLPFRLYATGPDLQELATHLTDEVHSTLLLGPSVDERTLPAALSSVIDRSVRAGRLRLLEIGQNRHGYHGLSIMSRPVYAARFLDTAELQIQAELRAGYLDDDYFRNTVDVLQTLEKLKPGPAAYAGHVATVLALADQHDQDGSYDESFGATCALYWMRATYLGRDSRKARASAAWIRRELPNYGDRERALFSAVFADTGELAADEQAAFLAVLHRLDLDQLSENDIIAYVQAAVAVDADDVLPVLTEALARRQVDGLWIDLATSATAASSLLDVLARLGDEADATVRDRVESMVFDAIVQIVDALERSSAARQRNPYPWDGRASTTVKCLEAWLKFDHALDFPVYNVVETLLRADTIATESAAGRAALAVLQELKNANERVTADGQETARQLKGVQRDARVGRIAVLSGLLVLYLLIGIVAGLVAEDGGRGFGAVLQAAFVRPWGFHLALASTATALLVLPWRRWLGVDRTQ